MSAKDEGTIKKLLMANGLLRFPVVLVYCIMGLIIGGLVTIIPEFSAEIAAMTQTHYPEFYATSGVKPDLMIPVFIIKYLPHGLIGILIVGILSAAMSSLSSTINSLGAVTVEDIFNRGTKKLDDQTYMKYSKLSIIFWGVVCIGAAYLFGNSEGTVIELINIISSQFNGPILATFVIAILIKRVNHVGMNAGLIGGVVINILIKINFDNIFWIWFNLTGFVLTLVIALVVSELYKTNPKETFVLDFKVQRTDILSKEVYILTGFFVAIVLLSMYLPSMLS